MNVVNCSSRGERRHKVPPSSGAKQVYEYEIDLSGEKKPRYTEDEHGASNLNVDGLDAKGLEIHLKGLREEIPKLTPEIRQMTIFRASKDSFFHFNTYDSEEEQNLATKRFIKWRESITEEFQDAITWH